MYFTNLRGEKRKPSKWFFRSHLHNFRSTVPQKRNTSHDKKKMLIKAFPFRTSFSFDWFSCWSCFCWCRTFFVISSIDCVGFLKLRNADVEQRIGLARSKKKSTRTRLVFRVNIPKIDGTYQTLQVASCPISCSKFLSLNWTLQEN